MGRALRVALVLSLGCGGGSSTTDGGARHTLTVTVSGNGSVASSPAGIACPSVCAFAFAEGTQVTLVASPQGGASFTAWGGGCSGSGSCAVTMSIDLQITASFVGAGDGGALPEDGGALPADGGSLPADGGVVFEVDIDINRGTVRFPNKYTNWQVGGAAQTNLVAYPEGWTVAGTAGTNFICLPPGWTNSGQAGTNFVGIPPGWTTGGAAGTGFTAIPPGWTNSGAAGTNFISLPPGWTNGGAPGTNFTALPPGWTDGGASGTNFIAMPPSGWTLGGAAGTNFVGLAAGWTNGGQAGTNFTALPPGWTNGGQSGTNFVAVPPGWTTGGASGTNFVAYPTSSVTTLELKFDDPGWLAIFQALKGTMTESALADVVTYAHFSYRRRNRPGNGKTQGDAAAGVW